MTGIKTGRIKVGDNIEKKSSENKINNTDSPLSSMEDLGINVP